MLLAEYQLRMKAYSLSVVEKEHDLHLQAYLNMAVQSTKERGNKIVPVFPTFKSFFDYEKRIKGITGEKKINNNHKGIKDLILIANKKGGNT